MFPTLITAQQPAHASRLEQLFSADPSVRGAAKTELLQHPDPALLPALLKALPSSKGTNRDDLFEILAKYDDPRKIPVFLALLKSTPADSGTGPIQEQLSRLGAPAAEALLAGCTGQDEAYANWAAGVLSWMHEIGARYLIEAVQSDDACKHAAGEQGLLYMSDADDVAREDTRLAADAAIDPDERIRGAAKQMVRDVERQGRGHRFFGHRRRAHRGLPVGCASGNDGEDCHNAFLARASPRHEVYARSAKRAKSGNPGHRKAVFVHVSSKIRTPSSK
jgi:hypothetical protein